MGSVPVAHDIGDMGEAMKKRLGAIGIAAYIVRRGSKLLRDVRPKKRIGLRKDIYMSKSGIVIIPGMGIVHPLEFKRVAGDKAYKALLKKPRRMTAFDL